MNNDHESPSIVYETWQHSASVTQKEISDMGDCNRDDEWNLKTRYLETAYFPEDHTREIITKGLKEALLSWDLIEDKMVCITTDSGANVVKATSLNDWTRLECFGHRLHSAIVSSALDIFRNYTEASLAGVCIMKDLELVVHEARLHNEHQYMDRTMGHLQYMADLSLQQTAEIESNISEGLMLYDSLELALSYRCERKKYIYFSSNEASENGNYFQNVPDSRLLPTVCILCSSKATDGKLRKYALRPVFPILQSGICIEVIDLGQDTKTTDAGSFFPLHSCLLSFPKLKLNIS
ncbi:hypothetical protein F2P81_018614 [Scophthalmus maximus]|uniref:Zinc finger BED domain-containing protein 4-like n=1 Tax=Scophthalmus maximus TaxID=52904 RepID=A0A6A4SA90_SCOMX|nr:hypothetical protein F2P81_018614 [Scophthalmus maximus]